MKSIYPFYVMMSLSPLMAAITAIFPEIQEISLRLTGLKSSITQTQEYDFENADFNWRIQRVDSCSQRLLEAYQEHDFESHFERLQGMEDVSREIKRDIGEFREKRQRKTKLPYVSQVFLFFNILQVSEIKSPLCSVFHAQ